MLLQHPLRPWLNSCLLFAFILSLASAQNETPKTAEAGIHLRHILIADTEPKVLALQPAADAGPVVTQDMPALATKEFSDFIAPYLSQAVTTESINRLARTIGEYLQKHDRPVVNVQIPTQNIADGNFRLVVAIGRYNQLQFKGNRWFSRELLEAKLGIKPGDEIRLSSLEEAVNWANTNPFRHIQVLINNLPTQPGTTDLIVGVQERVPVRLAAEYDNTGIILVGENHYTASLQFGNLWGLDHQGSYQYTTTDQSHLFQAHAMDYRVPLPWRHYLQFAAAYSIVQPTFGNGLFDLKGENLMADLRYVAPIEMAPWSFEFSAGLDFKESNNNLAFGGFQYYTTKNDVFQLALGATAARHDARGAWAFGLNVNVSPGQINSRNTDDVFSQAHYGAKARYLDGSLFVQRLTKLPAGFQIYSRGQIQLSSSNLLGSEQLSIGGQATVRGYDERIFSGDQGWLLSTEFQGPEWTNALPFLPKKTPPLKTRLLVFWDYARVEYKHSFPSDISLDPLMGTGLGLRCNVATNFSLSADFGWQLLKTTRPQPDHSRGHIRATLAF